MVAVDLWSSQQHCCDGIVNSCDVDGPTLVSPRVQRGADLHFEGTGESAYGTKFVMVAARSEEIRGRIILDMEWVPDKGGEAKVEGRRVEKSVHVEDRSVTLPESNVATVRLYAHGGAIGLGKLTDKGELDFVELPRPRTHRNQDASGLFPW